MDLPAPPLRLVLGALTLSLGIAPLACSSSPAKNNGGAGGTSSTGGTDGGTVTTTVIHGTGPVARHTSSIAVSPDGSTIYVVNADADSVSVIDAVGRKLLKEIPLASAPPGVDSTGHYTPSVAPRTLALSPGAGRLYVTGERSGKLYGIDLTSGTYDVILTVDVGSEPIGVLVSADEQNVYVSCSNDNTVVRVDASSAKVAATATITDGNSPLGNPIPGQPWGLGWSLDGSTLYATHIISPYVSALDPTSLTLKATFNIPDVAPRGNKLLANGQARGLYDVVARPGTSGELWVAHMMLAVGTPETDDSTTSLDFQSTAFPTLSILKDPGMFVTRLTSNAMSVPGDDGAFGDIVSGPHALEFTADGSYALMLDSASEDVLAVDANGRVEAQLLRPLYPTGGAMGHMQEGIVISPDGKHAYIDERNSATGATPDGGVATGPTGGDVAFIAIDTSNGISLTVDGPSVSRLSSDPMPADMRNGQFLFNTANSDLVGITTNHWVACASCHIEGRSDAVTWKFRQGPRDTPTNGGGKSDTGLLFRTADRVYVSDYWQTVDLEQGGTFGGSVSASGVATAPTDPTILQYMQDIQTYINFAIPTPMPPTTDPALVAQGKMIFESAMVGCSGCHSGPAYTDSVGSTLADPNLHDVGTCVTTGFPDVDHTDEDGDPRTACGGFNTPSLRGLASTPPYLHDGSAATLQDLLTITKGKMGDTTQLSSTELAALVAFLRSL